MVEKLQTVKDKAAEKRKFNSRVEEEMGFAFDEIVASKRSNSGSIESSFSSAAAAAADQKIANYIFVTRQSFNSCNSLAFNEIVRALTVAGSGYKPPGRDVIRTRLLDERYKVVLAANTERLNTFSLRGHGITITSDASTIHKRPLTNDIAVCPPESPILLNYEDATALYQGDDTKSAVPHQRRTLQVCPSSTTPI